MKIKITYFFYTDGDYSFRNLEKFGCEVMEDETIYTGEIAFQDEKIHSCKSDAKTFLEQLFCDQLHISYLHFYLMDDFYNMIKELVHFIESNDIGEFITKLSGDYDGTYIQVKIY